MGGIFQTIVRAGERLAIWAISLGLGFFPALSSAHVHPSPYFFAMLTQVNDRGFFRDAYFVTILLAVVGTTNLIDNIFRKPSLMYPLYRLAATINIAYYILLIVYATYAFSTIQLHVSLPVADFTVDSAVILVAVVVSAITEILIALGE